MPKKKEEERDEIDVLFPDGKPLPVESLKLAGEITPEEFAEGQRLAAELIGEWNANGQPDALGIDGILKQIGKR